MGSILPDMRVVTNLKKQNGVGPGEWLPRYQIEIVDIGSKPDRFGAEPEARRSRSLRSRVPFGQRH
jgi:hypothetical protein